MAHKTEYKAIDLALELILENGLEGLDQAVSILINEAMKVERSHALNAAPWERTGERKGYANGFKDKQLRSRLGTRKLGMVPFAQVDARYEKVRRDGTVRNCASWSPPASWTTDAAPSWA